MLYLQKDRLVPIDQPDSLLQIILWGAPATYINHQAGELSGYNTLLLPAYKNAVDYVLELFASPK